MYYLFVNHHLPPSVYFDAGYWDRALIRQFIRIEAEDYEEARREAGL